MLRRIAWLFGPIFAKEMIEIARRKRYYLSRVVYGVILLVVLLWVWYQYTRRFRTGGMDIKQMAALAENLFLAVSIVQYGAVFLFVPLFLCAVIAGEREERTLELLFTTQLRDRQIVLGKLGSRVAALVCLVLCGLPIMSLLLLFGGINPESLWRALAATLVAVLYAGAHAIYFSATTRSPLGALIRTYWWMTLWLVGVPLAISLVVHWVLTTAPMAAARVFVDYALGVLLMLNPVASFGLALEQRGYDRMEALLGAWFYPATFALPVGWALLLIWLAVRRVRREPTPFASWVARVPVVGAFWKEVRKAREARAAGRRDHAAAGRSRREVKNPLWLRSRRVRVYDREGHIGRIQWAAWAVALFFFFLMLALESNVLDDEECSKAFLTPTWIGIAALAALLAGSSLVGDRRRGFLELVLASPLTGREILDGTVLAVWEHFRRVYWLPLALGIVFTLTGASLVGGVIISFVSATLFIALVVLYGVACSLTARSFPAALVCSFLFPLVVIVGTVFLVAIFEGDHGPFLWVLCASLLVGSWVWVRRQTNVASVACFLTAVHLGLTAVAACWTYDGRRDGYPVGAMHPAFAVIATLDDKSQGWYRDRPWGAVLLCYWTALVVNFVWARWWLIRHFDRLAGRLGRPECEGRSLFKRLLHLADPLDRPPTGERPALVHAVLTNSTNGESSTREPAVPAPGP